ncbi:WD40 repeat domain-containing protein [Penaeicola halotolerans]|uniref:WD40 repeat domain-containing protein n=1 Tax=Penaeicola halotolerans TaxID=2793196 RepID=UPI001CF8EB4C|nr:WD40 repeat domain-containing protein [Penaeicola halotolerans]
MTKIQVSKINALTGHNDCVYALSRGRAANLFFSGAGDGMVVEWDLTQPKDGKLIAKVPQSVYAVCYDQARGQLLIGENYQGLHVIDLQTNRELYAVQLTDAAIFDIQVKGDLAWIATGDGVVIVFDLVRQGIIKHIKSSDKSARTISIHPDLEQFAVGYSDHLIRIFDFDYQLIQTLQGHTNSVFTVKYSPDGSYLLSAGRDAHLKAWNVVQAYVLQEDIIAHMYAINHIDFSADMKYFVTCSMDKSIKVWDLQSFKLLKVIDKARHAGHGTSINKLLWSDFDSLIVSASDDRTLSIWDLSFIPD